jgi:transketolase
MRYTVSELQEKADEIREEIIKMLVNVGSGHTGGALGAADFWTALYLGGLVRVDPSNPWDEERDRVVLSAGHYCPAQYAVLAEMGFFEKKELMSLRQVNSRLQGHPVVRCLPGIENTSGPLGQGISQAVGMAIVGKRERKQWRVVCFMGDGEQQEGQVWEAYMLANKEKLANLTVVIDRNNMQIDGRTEEVMPLEPLRTKLEAFGMEVFEADGHNVGLIMETFAKVRMVYERPSVILLHTIPGKGVRFMEGLVEWHGKAPSAAEAVEALSELGKTKDD